MNRRALKAYPPLLSHVIEGKEFRPLLDGPELSRHRSEWRQLMSDLIDCGPRDRAIADCFHTQWHVCHHHIRELVGNDELVIEMLWKWLPPYQGPDLLLYRGENVDRLAEGRIGTAWSPQEKTARMFASGWNAAGKGGVILETLAPAEAIIAGPSAHSKRIQEYEYTIDWRKLGSITRKGFFPPNH
ncbi:hypothetical protein BHU25_20775 [Pseudomonas vranovensis]|uniref:Uncharacterized protein n=2 Tax=Pseudomonas vranovensis TaxID=321661 RepID=A0A423D555_9PSED|nr:hypothetical protein BHU25_20775 [Pseudomonas vranovensis]